MIGEKSIEKAWMVGVAPATEDLVSEGTKGGKVNDYFISEVRRGIKIYEEFIQDFKLRDRRKLYSILTIAGVGASLFWNFAFFDLRLKVEDTEGTERYKTADRQYIDHFHRELLYSGFACLSKS